VVLAFLAVTFTPFPNWLAGRLIVPPRIESAEAIVVLGGGIEDSHTLSVISLRRTIQGIRLYRQGLAPTIIFSGGKAGQEVAEAKVMASLAVELGVPSTAIWVETKSNDTWTEALEVARLAQPKGVRKILLVTDPFHMKRASVAFERAGFQVLSASLEIAVANARKPEARLNLMRRVCQEAVARLYYWIRGQI
jgi:uncharacterized SAM-binding protein YcdF (DUF218 family)